MTMAVEGGEVYSVWGKNWTNSYGETCGTGQLKCEWIIFMFQV